MACIKPCRICTHAIPDIAIRSKLFSSANYNPDKRSGRKRLFNSGIGGRSPWNSPFPRWSGCLCQLINEGDAFYCGSALCSSALSILLGVFDTEIAKQIVEKLFLFQCSLRKQTFKILSSFHSSVPGEGVEHTASKTLASQAVQEGRTCLMQAAMNGHLRVVQFLVEQGANINMQAEVLQHSTLSDVTVAEAKT